MRRIRRATWIGLVAGLALAISSWAPVGGEEPDRTVARSASSVPSVGPTETVSTHARDATNVDGGLTARIAVGWGGRVTAVWYRPPGEGSHLGRLVSSVRADDGTWSDPVPISRTYRPPNGRNLDVAAGRDGQVSVVWSARRDGRTVVIGNYRQDGTWSGPARIGRGKEPHVVLDGDGETSVMWVRKKTRVATRAADGTWQRRTFARAGAPWGLDLAANRAGDETAMWSGLGCFCVWTVARDRSSAHWSSPRKLPGVFFNENGPALGVYRNGRVLATWNHVEGVYWARRSTTGRWSSPHRFGRTPGEIEQGGTMHTAITRNGHAMIEWYASYGGTIVSRHRPGEGFAKPVKLTDRDEFFVAQGPVLLTPDGTALVAGATRTALAYRWQSGPGDRWRPVELLDSTSDVDSVDARGRRMAALFEDEGLRARIIDVVPET